MYIYVNLRVTQTAMVEQRSIIADNVVQATDEKACNRGKSNGKLRSSKVTKKRVKPLGKKTMREFRNKLTTAKAQNAQTFDEFHCTIRKKGILITRVPQNFHTASSGFTSLCIMKNAGKNASRF